MLREINITSCRKAQCWKDSKLFKPNNERVRRLEFGLVVNLVFSGGVHG